MRQFGLDPVEEEEYNKFREEHKDCEFFSTVGGKFSITFTPTGLFDAVEVRCNSCGKTKDITDISNV